VRTEAEPPTNPHQEGMEIREPNATLSNKASFDTDVAVITQHLNSYLGGLPTKEYIIKTCKEVNILFKPGTDHPTCILPSNPRHLHLNKLQTQLWRKRWHHPINSKYMCIRSGCWTFLTYKNSVCQQHGPSRFSRLSLLVVKKPEAEIIRSRFFPCVPASLFVLYLLEREAHIPYGRRCEQVKFRQTAAQKSTPANTMDAVNSSIAPKDLLLVHKRDFHEETETNLYQEMSAFYWVSPRLLVHSCLILLHFITFLLS
jgi:hypothetical protein